MKLNINFLLLCLLSNVILYTSCTNDKLTREKAAELLIQHYEYPNVETQRLNLEMFGYSRFETLYDEGLLRKPSWGDIGVNVTKKGKLYFEGDKVITNVREFKEVTGIKFENAEETEATVEYSVIQKAPTPFGKYLDIFDGKEYSYSVKLAKYDDGWRIVEENPTGNISIFKHADFFKEYIKEMGKSEKLKDVSISIKQNIKEKTDDFERYDLIFIINGEEYIVESDILISYTDLIEDKKNEFPSCTIQYSPSYDFKYDIFYIERINNLIFIKKDEFYPQEDETISEIGIIIKEIFL